MSIILLFRTGGVCNRARGIGDIVRVHADLAVALINGRAEGRDLSAVVEESVGWAALAQSAETAARLRAPVAADVLERIDAEHPRLRRFGPRFLDAFVFRGAPGATSLLAALDRLQDGGKSAGESDDPPMDFVPARWLRLIRREGEIDRKLYELCVFSRLRDALRAGDVWVDGSSRYRRFEDRLLAPLPGTGKAAAGPVGDILRLDVETWIEGRRERLDALLALTERQAAEGALPDVTIRNGRLVVAPLKNATPETARDLARRLYGLLPRVRITDLIEEVDGWIGMSDCFGHLRTGQPAPDRRALYAAIIADGLNLGLTRMAEACEGTTYWGSVPEGGEMTP